MLSKFFSDNSRKNLALVVAKPISFLPANFVTLLAVFFALIAVYFILQKNFFFVLIFVLIAFLVDVLDGAVAKLRNQVTNFGNYFDAMVDKYVEVILYIGFSFIFPLESILALSGSLLLSYAKPRVALVIETDNRNWPAIGERADRAILLILGLAIYQFVQKFQGIDVLQFVLVLIALVTWIGSVQRILYARKLIEEAEKNGKILDYLKRK
ncbi:MAG: CDP-alcohol phosphatidyltransferase family protein [Candidatus Diapherotrites archaeon]|nr:CDP-alcohol phosphatidyltransferase family protein [Candidatus Diapherotrites archaeon]